jgi:hypothetical protein
VDAQPRTLAVPSVLSEEEGNLRMRARYQKGSLKQIKRKSGYLVWLFRWRETDPDGKRRPKKIVVGPVSELRRVSTTLRQVLTKFSEFFVCWIRVPSFPQEISRQDRLATTIGNSVDPQHPRFCRFSGAFRFFKSRLLRFICILPQAAFPEWKPAC